MNTDPSLRILMFDLETSPNLGFTWGKYEQNVNKFVQEWNLLCFAYKWLGEDEVHIVSMRNFPEYKRSKKNDFFVVKELHRLFNEADVVVAHNGASFDVKMAQTKFLIHGLSTPKPFVVVDTKRLAKRYGRFNSNSLDDLGETLNLGRKVKHEGFDMWLGCMAGDKKSWDMMEKYNKQDVVLLEKLYLKLRGYMPNHPRDWSGRPCRVPKCGSTKIQYRGGYRTKTKIYRRTYCKSCGSWDKELVK